MRDVARLGAGLGVALAIAIALAGGGCGSPAAITPVDGGAAADDLAMEQGDLARIRPDLWMPSACALGSLELESGGAPPATSVLGCSVEVCRYATSGPSGGFEICQLALQHIAVKTEEDKTTTPHHGCAMAPILPTTNGQQLQLDTVYIPLLGDGALLTAVMDQPQDVAAGDGLTLTLLRKDFAPPLGDDGTSIAAHLVPADKRFQFVAPDGGMVLAAYVVSPCTGKVAPSTYGIKATLATTPMSAVHFWSVSELDGQLQGPATGHADAMGMTVSTDANQGLGNLTWIVVSQAP